MPLDEHEGPYYLGIDLGGTNVRAGVVSNAGESLAHASRPTQADRGSDFGLDNIFQVSDQAVTACALSWDDIAGIGVAAPGTMDIPAGMLLKPHNLPGWQDVPIRQRIAQRFNKPAILQNDASAAAYGEYWVGAGRHAESLAFWTLGTGCGSGLIINDLILEGVHSCGSECGHIIIEMDNGRLCRSGQRGTLEAYVSATALVEICQEKLAEGRESVLSEWIAAGQILTPLLIAQAAESQDVLANELIMEMGRCLGVGTVTLMHAINPAVILIGGAMTFGRHSTELGRRFLERVKMEVRERAFPVPAERTLIDYATLGGSAGYIGAAGCIRRAIRLNEVPEW